MAEVCRRLASFSETPFRGLIWFLKAPRPCKPPFHLTRAIWNNFALKAGLWLKTKGCLSQRAGFLPPAFEKRSQQIMVNKWTKASPCADAGRPASKRRSKTTQTRMTRTYRAYSHASYPPLSLPVLLKLQICEAGGWLIWEGSEALLCDFSGRSCFMWQIWCIIKQRTLKMISEGARASVY